jgi:hypothetical protein
MRGAHAQPARAARQRTVADQQRARGLSPRAFPREAAYSDRAKAKLSPD